MAGVCVLATLDHHPRAQRRERLGRSAAVASVGPLVAGVELLPVPTWRGMTLSVGFPLLMMIAILYPPGAAGAIAVPGASDPRELRREVSVATALFNRAPVALSVIAAGTVFHVFQPPLQLLDAVADPGLDRCCGPGGRGRLVVNSGLVATFMSFELQDADSHSIRQLTIGGGRNSSVSYLGLGVLGLTSALCSRSRTLMYPRSSYSLFSLVRSSNGRTHSRKRTLSFRSVRRSARAVEQDGGGACRRAALDRRLLHDDLAQVLFRLSLQVDIARKMLDKEDLEDLKSQLEKIRDSKQETSDRIRALIRELHRSPLGATGLGESLESFTDEVGRDSGIQFHHDVQDIDLPAPIALLIFHIAREGVMNAFKHADPADVWIAVIEADENIVLELRDNGSGFDTAAPGPEGHFGMAMMRERAKVGGGTLDVASSPDDGTTITVRFPTSLLQRDQDGGTGPASANTQAHASLGTPGTKTPSAEGSRGAVPA